MRGLIAKFATPEAMVAAAKRLKAEGYSKLDGFSPHPVPEFAELIEPPTWRIGWTAALAALVGGGLTYFLIYWTAVEAYPLNVGGRPLHSWPAFLPAALVAAALWSGLATLAVMLRLAGLPRWHDPLFSIHQFDRATLDKFFLLVEADDPHFAPDRTRQLLESCGPEHLDEVPD